MKTIFLALVLTFFSVFPVSAINVPDGFVLQILEPTGGKIAMPKDWFYTENQRGPVLMWTLSRENPKIGPYQTGLRIEVCMGVKKGTGKSPKDFCQSFLDSKQKTTKVLSTFPETKQDLFTRQGIEVEEAITEEGKSTTYHIIYSTFWGNGTDLAVVTIAGTPTELWPQFEKAFDVMSEFELIDMKRFENK